MQGDTVKEGQAGCLLSEACRLFGLAGGYRMPGARLELLKVEWICGPVVLPGAGEERKEGKEHE